MLQRASYDDLNALTLSYDDLNAFVPFRYDNLNALAHLFRSSYFGLKMMPMEVW